MAEIAAPAREPLSGPTGQRVAAHRGELREVLRRHGVTNAELFGSAASGDDHEGSDVDMLVDFSPGTDITDIIGIKRELEDVLGVPVDLVPRNGLKERVRSRAAKDLLPLWPLRRRSTRRHRRSHHVDPLPPPAWPDLR